MKPNEIIVVDASKVPSNLYIDNRFPLKVVRSPRSLTLQRNIGIEVSKGKYIAFFDDDCILDSLCIQEVINAFRRFKSCRIGAVTGLMNPDQLAKGSRYYRLMRFLFLLGESGGKGIIKSSGYPSLPSGQRPQLIECLIGGGMVFQREALSDAKGFDEKLTGYAFMEDQDIAVRLRKNGWKLLYWPHMVFWHLPAESGRGNPASIARMKVLNSRYLLEKNFGKDVIRRASWWWSTIGLSILETRSFGAEALRGVAQGVRDVYHRRPPLH